MARITDALMGGEAFNEGQLHPTLNPQFGGQQGWNVDLHEWVNNQAQVTTNIVPFLLEPPLFMTRQPNTQAWLGTLNAIMTTHSIEIDGLQGGLEVETDDDTNIVGGSKVQQEIIDVVETKSEIVHSLVEKNGSPFRQFFYHWITMGRMHPDSKFASVGTMPDENRPADLLADQYTATMLYMATDAMHKKVQWSWIVTNMFPTTTGPIEGKRNKAEAREVVKLEIPFTGLTQFTIGSNVMAQNILDTLNTINANAYRRKQFIEKIHPDLEQAVKGYKETVDNAREDIIQTQAPAAESATPTT